MSSGARISFNDPRRFGMMKLVPRSELDREPLLRALGPEPLGNEFDAATLARACKGKKTSLKRAVGPAGRGRLGISMSARRSTAQGSRPKRRASTIATKAGARTSARKGWSMPSRRCSRRRSRPAARRWRDHAAPTAGLAISNTISRL